MATNPSPVNNVLLVPMRMDALCLTAETGAREAFADLSKLPYQYPHDNQPQIANPVANLSDQVLSDPIGQDPSDLVTVLDLKQKDLQPILPSLKDLAYLAHVRQPKDANGNVTYPERGTVLGNQLPQAAGSSTAYLVSSEGRYKSGSFDFQGAGSDDVIRLICLKSWRFSCTDKKQTFTKILDSLDRTPSTLRCPDSKNADADRYLAMGHGPLLHALRQGGKTVSFYHGPLSPGRSPDPVPADSPKFHKPLRAPEDGQEESVSPLDIDWSDTQRRVLGISKLATDIKVALKYAGEFTSAQFALEMIEGVQKVRFAGSLDD